MEIVFQEPSRGALLRHQGRGSGGKFLDFAIELREHPDVWAVLPDDVERTEKSASGTAQNIRRGTMKGFTQGEYDALADGTKVFVKFTGAVQPDKSGEPEGDPEAKGGEGGGTVTPMSGPRPGPVRSAAPDVVRAWAQNNGFNVPARGRMPEEVWAAYERAEGSKKERVPGY